MIVPDGKNLRSLRAFFETYPYLRSTELAQLANVSLRKILVWRRRCGLTSSGNGWGARYNKRPFEGVSPPRVEAELVLDPKVWDNQQWFEEQHKKGYGRRVITRITGKSDKCIKIRFRRYQIKPHAVRGSRNPCCNKRWLEENYEILGLSLEKCAALANVSHYTIYHWLVKFNLNIRDCQRTA